MKILMATMSLDIGGAETHIIELSRELKRLGHDITVASNGGVYVPELEEAGIRHVKLPLHTKNPAAALKCYAGLRRLIKKKKFDVVHAHARIPAFICGLLAKTLKFKFITTTHGVYDAPFYWKMLSDWGEHSLAVSYDVKQYLITEYSLPSDNITVTINGIDTERYVRDVPYDDIAKEFELAPDSGGHRILYVSRIDRESAHIGFQLVEAAPMLAAVYEDVELILVGGGSAFEELRAHADNVNRMLGRMVVRMTGPRTDVHKFMACADLFVGVSRSALEAMSASLPVILAGSQGYIGIFNADSLRTALDTNFCARGCRESTTSLIFEDIKEIFSTPAPELALRGAYNREIVLSRYSIRRMAEDALSVYQRMRPFEHYKYGEVVISGYYGFGNTGDDSLLRLITESLRSIRPDLRITVLSQAPRRTEREYGVHSVWRFNILRISRIMARPDCRLLINGGGSLLQDLTSSRSLFYYTYIMRLARRRSMAVMLYASGIGPLSRKKSRDKAREVLDDADLITLRDEQSLGTLSELGVTNPNVRLTADPAFRLEPSYGNWIKYVMNREGLTGENSYFAVAIRGRAAGIDTSEYENKLAFACKLIHEKYGLTAVFLPLQPQQDLTVSRNTAEKCGARLLTGLTAAEMTGLMAHMQFAISMRLHLLIYAADANIPAIALSCDPKIDALAASLGSEYLIQMDSFTSGTLVKMAAHLLENRDKIRAELALRVQKMRDLALTDAELAIKLLDG